MSEIKLLPCPFCGGEAGVFNRKTGFWAYCTNDECGAETQGKTNTPEAVEVWNTRAALSSAAVAAREPVVAAWQFKHYDPISGHPVWKTTLYWNGHRATEYRPLYLDPPPTSELEAEIARLRERVAELEKALDRLLVPFEGGECRRDHHGYCQTHFLEEDCSVDAARRVREGGKVE